MSSGDRTREQLEKENLQLRRRVGELEEALESGASSILSDHPSLLQTFLDSLPPVAMLLRPGTREIVACNRAGRDVGAVPGRTCYETWGQSDKPCPWCQAPTVWETGEAIHTQPEGAGRLWDAHWIPVGEDLYLHYAYDITDQVTAERSLRESEHYLALAQSIAHVGHWMLDPKTGVVSGSDELFRIFGLTREEATLDAFAEVVHPDDREYDLRHIRRGMEHGESWDIEHRLVCRDGTEKTVRAIGKAITDDAGEVVQLIGTVHDVTDHRRAEEKLRKAEEQSRAWLEYSPICTKIVDLDFNLEYMSSSGIKELKIQDTAQIYGKPYPFDFYPESFRREMTGNLTLARDTGEVITQEAAVVDVEGNELWYQSTIVPVHDDEGRVEYLIVVSIETTERRRAEDALRGSDERFRRMADTIPNVFWLADAETRDIIYISPAYEKIWGKPTAELLEEPGSWLEAVHPDDREQVEARERGESAGDRSATQGQYEYRILRPDGDVRWIGSREFAIRDEGGKMTMLCGVAEDITERKLAEDALKRNEERFRCLAESTPMGLFETDVEGRVLYTNPTWCSITGMSMEESLGFGWAGALHKDDRDRVAAEWSDCLRERKGYSGEFRFTRPSGETRWVYTRTAPIFDEAGEVVGHVGANQDITERRRAEEALRESEERFRLMVLNSPDMTLIEGADGIGTYMSPQVTEVVGHPAERFIGRGFPDIIHPNDLPAVIDAHQRAFAEEELVDFRYRVIDGEGKTRWLSHTARPLYRDGKFAEVQSNVRNITERERMAESLGWESAVNRLLAELSSALIDPSLSIEEIAGVVLESAKELTGSQHGYVSSVDPVTGDNIGLTLTQMMLNCPVRDGDGGVTFPKGEDGRYPGLWGHALNTREAILTNSPADHEASHGLPKGHVPLENFLSAPALIGDELVGQIALANCEAGYSERDLEAIERLAKLYAIAVQGKRTEGAVRNIARFPGENPSPVLRIASDGKIQYANPASRPLLDGWGCDEGGRAPEDIRGLVTVARDSGDSQMADISVGDALFSFVVAPVPDADYVNLYGRNVTEHRKLEEQLRQSQKLEAIGQLAGGIAHDFSNLLQSILGYSNMLKMQSAPGSTVYRAADVTEKAATRASDLTKQLLGFARRGKLQNTPVDLHRIVHDTVAIISRTVSKSIKISLRLEADPSVVLGDPSQLEQLVMNLAVNARDAMPEGGRLLVETSNVELGDDYCREHAEMTPGPYLLVNVSDTGVGMTDEVRERLFVPFFTTKERGRGTGMGLAMVYGIVKNHGGSVNVYSMPGTGATFQIHLPMAQEPEGITDTQELKELVHGSATILVVDDEESVRQICMDMLTRLGYKVLLVKDGNEAVRCYEERGDEIDLVILDMTMPVMDGRECFRKLREIDPSVKVVVSTGHALNGAAQTIMDEGAARFLQKPFVLAQLSEAVAKALHGDRAEDVAPGARPEADGAAAQEDIEVLRDDSLEALTEMLQHLIRLKALLSEDEGAAESIDAMTGRLREMIGQGGSGVVEEPLWHGFGNLVGGIRYFVAGSLGDQEEGDDVSRGARAVEDSARRAMELMARWREAVRRHGTK
ncbi:MAG: PAS domain S-box protein [Planctomycetota bacterium]|jgi:PAS domain S-box-containing protein